MGRKPTTPPVVCEHFTWRLFRRAGVYYADGRTGARPLGKHSLGTRDPERALANLRLLDRRKAVELGVAPATTAPIPCELTLADGWEQYLDHCAQTDVLGGTCAKTRQRYRAVRDKHLAFGTRRGLRFWAEVDKASLEAYSAELSRGGYAPRTIYLELTLLMSVLRWLVDEGRLPPTCRVRLRLQKPQGSGTYCYSAAEVRAMVEHCRGRGDLHWLADVIVALACTGLRIGELASLRWSDFGERLTTLRLTDDRASSRRKGLGPIRTTKGKRDRALPVHPDLRAILAGLARHSDNRVFHGPRSGKLKPDTVRSVLVREVIQPLKARFPTPVGDVGFEHGRVHSFRHYFCSQAFLGGATEAEVVEWLGHRDSKMTALYRHLRDEDSQRRMEAISFLGSGGRAVRPSEAG